MHTLHVCLYTTSYSLASFGIINFERQNRRQLISGTPLPHLPKEVCLRFYTVLISLCRGVKLISFWAIFFLSGLLNFWLKSYSGCSENLDPFVTLESIKGAILAKTVLGCVYNVF